MVDRCMGADNPHPHPHPTPNQYLYINSPGGSVIAGLALYDTFG